MHLRHPDLVECAFHPQPVDFHSDLGHPRCLHVLHHLVLPGAEPHRSGLRERPHRHLGGGRKGGHPRESVREGIPAAGLHPGFRVHGLFRRPLQLLAGERESDLLQVPSGKVPAGFPPQVLRTERACVQLPPEQVRGSLFQADRGHLRPADRLLFRARQHGEPRRPVRRHQVRLPHRPDTSRKRFSSGQLASMFAAMSWLWST